MKKLEAGSAVDGVITTVLADTFISPAPKKKFLAFSEQVRDGLLSHVFLVVWPLSRVSCSLPLTCCSVECETLELEEQETGPTASQPEESPDDSQHRGLPVVWDKDR